MRMRLAAMEEHCGGLQMMLLPVDADSAIQNIRMTMALLPGEVPPLLESEWELDLQPAEPMAAEIHIEPVSPSGS